MIGIEDIDEKYDVILADPPWGYRDKRIGYGGHSPYYKSMSDKDLVGLPVSEIAKDDCFLFLWATFPNLDKALNLIAGWSFRYVTLGFSWIKTNRRNGKPFFGVGSYTKSNCEVCLLAKRGRPKVASNYVSSVVISPLRGHSQKPPGVVDGIEELCGDVRRIELFAREERNGWDSWGDEIDGWYTKNSTIK